MHTVIFISTYAYLYRWADFGRLRDGLELPLIFPFVVGAFALWDIMYYCEVTD